MIGSVPNGRPDNPLAISAPGRHAARMAESPPFFVGAVILAAGFSTRMGGPKLLLPWGETTVLGQLLNQWGNLPTAQIAVVCQAGDQALHAELDRLQFPTASRITNPEPERGMFSSIQCAARWNGWRPDLTHWAIALGDQPHLAAPTLRALAEFAGRQRDKICQPARNGHARHPVFLPSPAWVALPGATETTLKQFLSARGTDVRLIELNDPGLDLDMDRPVDYEKAKHLFFTQRNR
jgi:molybdenum cofactor cytidylyltransferase